jgi:hypothetical protein
VTGQHPHGLHPDEERGGDHRGHHPNCP